MKIQFRANRMARARAEKIKMPNREWHVQGRPGGRGTKYEIYKLVCAGAINFHFRLKSIFESTARSVLFLFRFFPEFHWTHSAVGTHIRIWWVEDWLTKKESETQFARFIDGCIDVASSREKA